MIRVLVSIVIFMGGYIVGVNTSSVVDREWAAETARVYAQCLPRQRYHWLEPAINASIRGLKTVPERRLP